MNYQLVIFERKGKFWAYYCDASRPPHYDLTMEQVFDKSVKGVLEKARGIKPTDGQVLFTYIDRDNN